MHRPLDYRSIKTIQHDRQIRSRARAEAARASELAKRARRSGRPASRRRPQGPRP